jgi:hypothetical protein
VIVSPIQGIGHLVILYKYVRAIQVINNLIIYCSMIVKAMQGLGHVIIRDDCRCHLRVRYSNLVFLYCYHCIGRDRPLIIQYV